MSKADGTETKILLVMFLISTWLYPSLYWNDAETDDQDKEPMIDTKIF